ncbi:uncharacterized protein LOC108737536 isoform X4 [Agrilus planipennis]|uniref:Uncharacterized protein LOC108737536 isoform X4 n=1 Tax=Agrilus planipennis TaxID=224129 RepID=A0A1W4X0W4_AGRPL|nr:uncharacterized protein LOC108737536 isoform X4 [Agrilus planipennis]
MADVNATLNNSADNESGETVVSVVKELESTANSQSSSDQVNKPIDTGKSEQQAVFSQEDAVEEFLAGESKDDLLICNLGNDDIDDNQGIEFKRENTVDCCGDLKNKDFGNVPITRRKFRKTVCKLSQRNSIVNLIKKRSIKCLIKRHAMEGVQENSDVTSEVQDSPTVGQENHNDSAETNDSQELNKTNSENQKYSPENSSDDYPTTKKDSDFHEEVTENGSCSNEDITDRINDDDKSVREPQNGNTTANGKVNKRKKEDDESTVKKLKSEVQQSYSIRNKIFNELIESPACKTIDQIQSRIERIVLEIRTLNDIAIEKEREWNSIIHLRKLKEELLLRMQRRKQVMLYNSRDLGDPDRSDNCVESNQGSRSPQQAGSKVSNSNYHDGNRQQGSLSILSNYVEMNGHSTDSKNIKQRPVIDVQSIIADYRQRHPETVPRRGRRIRTSLTSQQNDLVGSRMSQSGTMNFASMALGSGAQVKHNLHNKMDMNAELGMFFNAIENVSSKHNGSKLSGSVPEIQGTSDEPSFKDVLMQFAKLSQNERCELIQNALKPPPPYPEVTVHPVPVSTPQPKNSLLHGILTQAQPKTENKTTFSPTLAKLLTAPEKSIASTMSTNVQTSNNLLNNSENVSISDILTHNKTRHQITITPVATQCDIHNKSKTTSQADEDEAEDSADRLVIDEGEGGDRNRTDSSCDLMGFEIPQCQGCNQQPAQFVCAGCGNQWYCSRDCQVSSWDEHSEVCSD